jgi:hypothetical protein
MNTNWQHLKTLLRIISVLAPIFGNDRGAQTELAKLFSRKSF